MLALGAALVALAIPANSLGYISPSGQKFEIAGNGSMRLEGSLGSCPIAKFTGETVGSEIVQLAAPTVGTCSSGTSLTFSGSWGMVAGAAAPVISISGPVGGLTMRFSSLPGCKLTNSASAAVLSGIWSNGTTTPNKTKSYFTPASGITLTWATDGASCALAGQQEIVAFKSDRVQGLLTVPVLNPVNNLTNPGTPIVVAPA